MGIREATLLKLDVYVAGLYLPAPMHDGASVLREMNTTRMVITLLRDVTRDKMIEALRKDLKRNADAATPAIAGPAAQLERLIPDLRSGDMIVFTYLPEGAGLLLVQLNGHDRGRIAGGDFARAFFGIWLNKAPTDELKRGLLGGPCQ
jgi:hypothetical protein